MKSCNTFLYLKLKGLLNIEILKCSKCNKVNNLNCVLGSVRENIVLLGDNFFVILYFKQTHLPCSSVQMAVVPEEPGEGLEGGGLLQVRTPQVAHHGTRVGGSQGTGTLTGLAGLLGE